MPKSNKSDSVRQSAPLFHIDTTQWPTRFLQQALNGGVSGWPPKFQKVIARLAKDEVRTFWFRILKSCSVSNKAFREAKHARDVLERSMEAPTLQDGLEFYLVDNIVNAYWEAIDIVIQYQTKGQRDPRQGLFKDLEKLQRLTAKIEAEYRELNHSLSMFLDPLQASIAAQCKRLNRTLNQFLGYLQARQELDFSFCRGVKKQYGVAASTFAALLKAQYLADCPFSDYQFARLTCLTFNEGRIYIENGDLCRLKEGFEPFEGDELDRLKKFLAPVNPHSTRNL